MLGGRAAVPQSDGVWNGVRMGRPQASSRDSHGAFCWDRRVAERQQHLRGRRRGPDRARGEGGERAGGADCLVRRAWPCGDTDRAGVPVYNLFIMLIGPAIAVAVWLMLTRTTAGRMLRAAALDREMLGALGANVGMLYTGMFALASFLAGLSGALVTPIQSIVPGMDVEIIVQAFIVVVIGGLGSFWGTFLGSVIYGQVLSFGILIFPGFSLFSVFALMAVILILRPWGLLGRPLR